MSDLGYNKKQKWRINMDIIDYDMRKLNIFWLLNTSGSMAGSKIEQLNKAMRTTLDFALKASHLNEINLSIRVIEFNSKVRCAFRRSMR